MRSELAEQQVVVRELRRAGVVFFAVPNGARRNRQEQARAKMEGLQPGVPDLILPAPTCTHQPTSITDACLCPRCRGYVGAVVEMKRADGGRVSERQREWLDWFAANGWLAVVGVGAEAALEALRDAGWPVRVPRSPGSREMP